jgi:hypothetical protein
MFTREEISSVGRAVITGGRSVRLTTADGEWLVAVLRQAHIAEVAVGGASGVDTDAEAVLRAAQFTVFRFPAKWDTEGKSAGFRRNWAMGKWADGRGSLLVAFPGGNGTAHMVSVAKRLRLRIVRRHPEPGRPHGEPIKSPVVPGTCVQVGPLQKAHAVRETRQLQAAGITVAQPPVALTRYTVQQSNPRVIALRREVDRLERSIYDAQQEITRLRLAIEAEYTATQN